MTFDTSYGKVRIFFSHLLTRDGERATLARIKMVAHPSGWGLAICSKKDRFCKEMGRKIALLRAMKDLPLSKNDREELWGHYFSRLPE